MIPKCHAALSKGVKGAGENVVSQNLFYLKNRQNEIFLIEKVNKSKNVASFWCRPKPLTPIVYL